MKCENAELRPKNVVSQDGCTFLSCFRGKIRLESLSIAKL